MEKKQTAVEFFWNEISDVLPFSVDSITAIKIYEIIQQAKEMEKEQMKEAFVECWKSNVPDGVECKLDAEQYYNETFKSE